jgi:phosphoglycolate phosphatase
MDILFDLDGTLIDPAAGIITSMQAGLRAVGAPVPAAETLQWVIGPSLRQSIPQLGVTDVDGVLTAYRATYTGGAMYDATIYPGIIATLGALQATGHRLFVATSKPHAFARPIVAHFGMAGYFKAVHGPELDGTRDDKADLIAHMITVEAINPANALMIGDRLFDCRGATRNGIKTLGVAWGYGSRQELTEAGAIAIIDTPAQLPNAIAQHAV